MANVTPAQPLNATLVSSPVVRKVAFRGGNNKYLGWNKGGFLNFCYDDLTSPFVKHELVEENDEKTNGERHVHIKCCFNQKFWRKEGPESSLIVAGGGSADTDNSTWSCSLFRLVFLDEDAKANMTGALQLHLLQQTKPLAICSESESGVSSLFARADELNGILYAVSLDILPQYVAFKGDNGRYLGCATVGLGSTLWLQFNAGNFSNPNVPNEVTASSGSTQFRHMTIGRNWKRMSDTYIALDPANGTGQQDHRFMPIQLDDHTVALRSLGNNLLSKRFYNSWGGQHYIRPMTSTIEEFARLTVEEPVVWRRVHSVEYDLNNFEISNQRPVVLQTLSATNNSSSNSGTHNMNFARTVKNSRTWSNSVSYTTGVSGSFTLGIADYLGFGLQVSAEETRTMEWGKAEEEEITLGGIYTVTPEPGQSMTVRLLATEATCSVKFSYVQEDLLVTGNWVSKSRDDGHFTGVTHINLQYDASLN